MFCVNIIYLAPEQVKAKRDAVRAKDKEKHLKIAEERKKTLLRKQELENEQQKWHQTGQEKNISIKNLAKAETKGISSIS